MSYRPKTENFAQLKGTFCLDILGQSRYLVVLTLWFLAIMKLTRNHGDSDLTLSFCRISVNSFSASR